MTTHADIEDAAKTYADTRARLGERVDSLQYEILALRRRRLPGIRSAVESVATARQALIDLVDGARDLFTKPRTRIFHGVKVGLTKGKGKITWEDDETVVRLIRKHFADRADTLIKLKETPSKTALADLSAAELKKLGVTVEEAGDQVVAKPTESEIDKLVAALLEDDADSAEENAR